MLSSCKNARKDDGWGQVGAPSASQRAGGPPPCCGVPRACSAAAARARRAPARAEGARGSPEPAKRLHATAQTELEGRRIASGATGCIRPRCGEQAMQPRERLLQRQRQASKHRSGRRLNLKAAGNQTSQRKASKITQAGVQTSQRQASKPHSGRRLNLTAAGV
eukprot:5221040-Pleurochrysis_carterae.AAC.5